MCLCAHILTQKNCLLASLSNKNTFTRTTHKHTHMHGFKWPQAQIRVTGARIHHPYSFNHRFLTLKYYRLLLCYFAMDFHIPLGHRRLWSPPGYPTHTHTHTRTHITERYIPFFCYSDCRSFKRPATKCYISTEHGRRYRL